MRRPCLFVRSAPRMMPLFQDGRGSCLKTRCTTLVPKFSADLEDAVAVGLQFQDFRLYFGLNPAPAQFRSFRPLLALADVCSSG